MRLPLARFALAAALLAGLPAAASSAVHVSLAITPATLAQCSTGHVTFTLGNDGAAPIKARVCFSLAVNGTALCLPVCGRAPLPAGSSFTKEFDFWLPPIVPPGVYAITASATASDGSSDQSTATVTVTPTAPADCHFPGGPATPSDLMGAFVTNSGLTLDSPTPTQPSTWGTVKAIYR
jgi:hypothetical protein